MSYIKKWNKILLFKLIYFLYVIILLMILICFNTNVDK